jgi:hypothetical protein
MNLNSINFENILIYIIFFIKRYQDPQATIPNILWNNIGQGKVEISAWHDTNTHFFMALSHITQEWLAEIVPKKNYTDLQNTISNNLEKFEEN